MPWWDLSQITIADLIQFTQPSGDPIYALPFQRIINNFDFLKGRIRYGVGQPNFTPEQDTLIYVQVDVYPRKLWLWANNAWESFQTEHDILYGNGNPTANPQLPRALYVNLQNNALWYWNGTQWGLIQSGLTEQEVLTILDNRNLYGYIDLTNATEDYFLRRGEKAIIYANNVTSKPLRIATQSGTAYNIYVYPLVAFGTQQTSNYIFLNPNNTTYSSQFYVRVISNYGNFSNITQSSFLIGYTLGVIVLFVWNWLQHKATIALSQRCEETAMYFFNSVTIWNNTTTPWTSLGTIVWPQASSAYILVHRIF